MSPEQAMGDRTLDARSDVYSLAAVLYEMLAGEPPYTGPTAQAIVAKVITERPVPITVHRDTVPPHVAATLQKALAKLPADRFAGAAQFSEALQRPGAVPLNLTGAGDLAAPGATRRDRRIAVLAAALVAATALAVWGLLRPQPPPQVARLALTTPAGQEIVDQYGTSFALSPDGSRLAYVGPGEGGPQLWLRPLDQVRANPVPAPSARSRRRSPATASPSASWSARLAPRRSRSCRSAGVRPSRSPIQPLACRGTGRVAVLHTG